MKSLIKNALGVLRGGSVRDLVDEFKYVDEPPEERKESYDYEETRESDSFVNKMVGVARGGPLKPIVCNKYLKFVKYVDEPSEEKYDCMTARKLDSWVDKLVDVSRGGPLKPVVHDKYLKFVSKVKKQRKKALVGLVAGSCILAGGYGLVDYSKKWVDNRIKDLVVQNEQWVNKKFGEYGRKDRTWTKERLKEEIAKYEQKDKEWSNEEFEARVPLEELISAFNSTYQVINEAFYETREGSIISAGASSGSGILLKGGYLLTAKHVADEKFRSQYSDFYWGMVKYHHNNLSIAYVNGGVEIEVKVEKILEGPGSGYTYDYAILKLKDDIDQFSFYEHGLNLPNEVKPGMRSAAIGFPLGDGRNIRLGNVEQSDSDVGDNYVTFKNSIIFGDSGGPLFVIENGEVKLTALSAMLRVMPDWYYKTFHPVNIGYGLKVETIVKNIEEQLSSGNLDEETAKEVKNFLDLNK